MRPKKEEIDAAVSRVAKAHLSVDVRRLEDDAVLLLREVMGLREELDQVRGDLRRVIHAKDYLKKSKGAKA